MSAPLLETALLRFLPRRGVPKRLEAAMQYTLFNAGKRVRPAIVLEVCRALGGDLRLAMPAACAIEYIHTYSLIHDDLPAMDDDDYRRGKLSSHRKFGEATAILAGDALLTAAFEALARTPDPRLVAPLVDALAKGAGAAGMVGGQELDLAKRPQLDLVHAMKTAALFEASARMGAIAAKSRRVNDLGRFGRHLGLAFQIVDDILDPSDRKERNYAGVHGVDAARRRATRETAAANAALRFLGSRGDRLRAIADTVLTRRS